MLGALWRRLAGWLGRSGDREPETNTSDAGSGEEEPDSRGFLPSRLDASVLFAHGKRADLEATDDETVANLEAEAQAAEARERRED